MALRKFKIKLEGKIYEAEVEEIIEMEENIKKEILFSINGRYFLEILNAIDDDVLLEINLVDKNKPIVFHPVTKSNTTYIIMPMMSE